MPEVTTPRVIVVADIPRQRERAASEAAARPAAPAPSRGHQPSSARRLVATLALALALPAAAAVVATAGISAGHSTPSRSSGAGLHVLLLDAFGQNVPARVHGPTGPHWLKHLLVGPAGSRR